MAYRIDPVKGLVFESQSTVPQGITTEPRNINEMRMQPEMGSAFNQPQTFSVPPGSKQSPAQWDEDLSVTPIMQPQVVDNQIQPTGQTRANELRQKYGQPGIFDNYESFQPKPRAASFFDSFNNDYNQRLEKEKGRQATGIANFFSGASIPENQKMPLTMGLLSFGAQLLADSGNNNMFLAQGIGRGLQAGIGGYNAAMTSQQKAAQFQAEQQMEQQRLQMQQARDNVNANYINAQIGQINLQKQNQQNTIDLGKRLRTQIPKLIESKTITPQEGDMLMSYSDFQLGNQLPTMIQQGPQRMTQQLSYEMLADEMESYKKVPDVMKALEESGNYTEQQLATLRPLTGKNFYNQLKTIKPITAPTNMSMGNARGFLSGLAAAKMLDVNNPEHQIAFNAAYPLFETKVVKDSMGNESLVTVPSVTPIPEPLKIFRQDGPSKDGGKPIMLSEAKPSPSDLTTAEYGAAMYDSQMKLDALFKKGYRPSYTIAQQILAADETFTMAGLYAQTNNFNDREFITQAYSFADAYARARTGATMNEQEFPRYFRMFFVNPPIKGDISPAEFISRRNDRLQAIARTITKSGAGWTKRFGNQERYQKPFMSPFNSDGSSNSVYEDEFKKIKTRRQQSNVTTGGVDVTSNRKSARR